MKILFLTLVHIESISERNLYADLMRKFRDEGHDVFIVTPIERRLKQSTTLIKTDKVSLLKVKILNIQKTNLFEKGIATLQIENQYLAGIKRHFRVRFDLILYSTPPITFAKVIRYIKHRDNAISYLLLKDIFPQNAVDLGMIKKGGLIHRYFRHKEKKLYRISDFIGCMSPANVDYLLKNNPEINPEIVEVNPNSIEPHSTAISENEKLKVRKQYNIPVAATTFIYGGNLGKPQGIDFLLQVLESTKERNDLFFVIVGSGTEFLKVKIWFIENNPNNTILLAGLPKSEYDQLIQTCDIGLIFLDSRFTIPNFPSRILSYMEFRMPVIAATDVNTDMGSIIEKHKFGFWAESGDLLKIVRHIDYFATNKNKIIEMGLNGFNHLHQNYTVSHSYQQIVKHFND